MIVNYGSVAEYPPVNEQKQACSSIFRQNEHNLFKSLLYYLRTVDSTCCARAVLCPRKNIRNIHH